MKQMTLVFFPYRALPTNCLHRVVPPRSNKNAAISEINKLVKVYADGQQIYDFDEDRLKTKWKLS